MSPLNSIPAGVATSGTLAIVSQLQAPSKPGSRATAVEQQLRNGIGIGVLEAGDRLPSEQIMALHMGVSSLTFRQALDRLRADGLVKTRPGRGGGTFINASLSVLERLAKESLEATSLAEIADIGQSVAELHSSAARLAAHRRDENDLSELHKSLERLLTPMSAIGRRRASTLYVINTARVARAEALLAALVPLIGRFQLMAWTDSIDDSANALNLAASRTIEAIEQAQPDDAAVAAREHVQLAVQQIVRDRSHMLAEAATSDAITPSDAFHRFQGHIHDIKNSLEAGQKQISQLDPPRYARGQSSETIDQILKNIADNNSELLRGAGIAYAPGMLTDARLWMDWWDSDYGRELSFKSHEFNVRSLQYYDYEKMPWYTEPLRTGGFSLVGPYLDRGGIETSTITASLPISSGPFEGCVIGGDLHVPAIEHLLLNDSRATAIDHVLVNHNNRVVVSTAPTIMHGSLMSSKDLEGFTVAAQEKETALTKWRLLSHLR